jgi:hypothetical protein
MSISTTNAMEQSFGMFVNRIQVKVKRGLPSLVQKMEVSSIVLQEKIDIVDMQKNTKSKMEVEYNIVLYDMIHT